MIIFSEGGGNKNKKEPYRLNNCYKHHVAVVEIMASSLVATQARTLSKLVDLHFNCQEEEKKNTKSFSVFNKNSGHFLDFTERDD